MHIPEMQNVQPFETTLEGQSIVLKGEKGTLADRGLQSLGIFCVVPFSSSGFRQPALSSVQLARDMACL